MQEWLWTASEDEIDSWLADEKARLRYEIQLIELKFDFLAMDIVLDELKKYNPSQPRASRGTPNGGQWIAVGGSAARRRVELEKLKPVEATVAPKNPKLDLVHMVDSAQVITDEVIEKVAKKPRNRMVTDYDPEQDSEWQAGYYTLGKYAKLKLYIFSEEIEAVAVENNIDPNLIRGVLTNEAITRFGAGHLEGAISGVRDILGGYGTYGMGQLGPEAREYSDINIVEALTTEGAIRGAGNWLGEQRRILVEEGYLDPNNTQIATRYNSGAVNSGSVTNYGKRVQYLIDNLYKND